MPSEQQSLSSFLARVKGEDLSTIVLNPFGVRVGTPLSVYGLNEENFQVENISEMLFKLGNKRIRTTSYGLRVVGGDTTKVYQLRFSPSMAVSEHEWKHDWLLLAPITDIAGASENLLTRISEYRGSVPSKIFCLDGDDFHRLGTDYQGIDTHVYEVRDADGDGEAKHNEATEKRMRHWVFFRKKTTSVLADKIQEHLAAPQQTEPEGVPDAKSASQPANGTTSQIEFIVIERDDAGVRILQGIRIPLISVEEK